MKLTLDEIRTYCFGALAVDEHEGAAYFRRLPEGLLPVYADNPGAVTRLRSPACVRLRFQSDTTSLRVAFRYDTFARALFLGALSVDGAPAITFGASEHMPEWSGEIFRAESSAMRTFDLWMPHLCDTALLALEVDDNCTLQPAPALPRRWLAYGDSITQGMTVASPTDTLGAKIALALNADVLNLGVGGGKVVAEMSTNIPDGEFDLISIAYGTNDFNHGVPLNTYEDNTRLLLAALETRFPNTPVMLISVIPWADRTDPNTNGDSLQDYRDRAIAAATGFANVTLVPGPDIIDDNPALFVDNVHPNEAGMQMYAEHFRAFAQPLLATP